MNYLSLGQVHARPCPARPFGNTPQHIPAPVRVPRCGPCLRTVVLQVWVAEPCPDLTPFPLLRVPFPCPFLRPPASMSPTRTPPRNPPALPPRAHAPFATRVCAQERVRSAPTRARWTSSRRRSRTTWRRGRRPRFFDEMVDQMAVQIMDKIIPRGGALSDGGGGGGKGGLHVPLGAGSRAERGREPDPQPHTLSPPLPPPNPRPPVRFAPRRAK